MHQRLHQHLLMVGAALAVVFSLIGWLLARRITRPLHDLVDVARGIEAGYAVRARTEGVYTEGATLGRAFNSLIEQLQRNEAEVRQLNVSLERRVAERTAEMEDAFNRLSENEARVQTLIETAQDPFVAVDFEGRITEWNTQAEKLFGWRRDEVLGESLAHTVLPERYQAAFVEALARHRTTGEAPFTNRLL
ncbi:MAG: PAS domain-containing protein, partial [Gammaproteobacteria bacterium]